MRCLCIGICQTDAVATILKQIPEFTKIYDDILVYTVFAISIDEMKNILETVVPTCDLIISQPVSENYRDTDLFSSSKLRSSLKSNAKHLIFSNCYFTGYDPCPFQLTNKNHEIIHIDNISYIPSLCLESLLNKQIEQACIDWCNPESYSDSELFKNYNLSITQLKTREDKIFNNDFGVDIKISDFIEQNYKSQHLFHTYNHPTNILLIELANRILSNINIQGTIPDIKKELLGTMSIPPPLSLYLKYKMSFTYPFFIINNQPYTTQETMTILSETLSKADHTLFNQFRSTVKYARSLIS